MLETWIMRDAWFQAVKNNAGLHLAGAGSLLCYAYLSSMSRQDGVFPLETFYLCVGLPWLLLLVLFLRRLLGRGGEISLKGVILWAVLFRVAGLLAEPVYEDDYFRFLWDGYRFAESGDPYGTTPLSHFGDQAVPDAYKDVLDFVNHPELPTIYGPLLEYVFLLSHYLWPAKLVGLKLLFILAEAGTLFALWKVLCPRRFLLAAWCPLLVIETSFQAHPDIIAIGCLAWGLVMALRRRPWASMICLALASSAKVFAVLACPFWWEKKHWFKQGMLMGGVIVLLYSPFLLQGSDAGRTSLQAMAQEWEFNSAFYGLLRSWLDPNVARLTCLGLFGVSYVALLGWFWRRRMNGWEGDPPLDLVFGCFFLFSPVINPWYLLWMFPFVVKNPRCWSVTALAVVSMSYITGLNLQDDRWGNFENPLSVKLIEFGAIILSVVMDLFISRSRRD